MDDIISINPQMCVSLQQKTENAYFARVFDS